MDKGGILGNVLEGIGEELKETGKTVVEQIGVSQKKDKDFVKDLYGVDGQSMTQGEIKKKELEDKRSQEELKQKLKQRFHAEYFQRATSPPRPQEVRPAEKVEQERQEERWELKKKEAKKPGPLPYSARQQAGSAEVVKIPGG